MKTLFVGAGAIGSLLAGYAAKGGTDVTLLDIADYIHTIGKEGLNIRTVGGDTFNVKVKATADAKAINDIDLLILTVKTFHTEPALASVAHLKDRVRCVLSVQNGVEKEEHLARFFGKEKVLGAICLEGATRLGPNEYPAHHVEHHLRGRAGREDVGARRQRSGAFGFRGHKGGGEHGESFRPPGRNGSISLPRRSSAP